MSEVKEPKQLTHAETVEKLAEFHRIKPLKGAETAVYVPVNIKQDPDTKRMMVPPSVQVNNTITIINPHTKLPEQLVYVKSERSEKIGGQYHTIQDTPLIFIENGTKVLTAKDKLLYLHMEMTDENESKKDRDTKVTPKFRRLDKEKTATQKMEEVFDLEYVLTMLREAEVEDIVAMARIHKVNTDRSVDEIKYDLVVIAKKDPMEFIRLSPNKKDKLKVTVADAKGTGIIAYEGITRKWSVKGKEGERDVLEINPGQNSEDELIDYLMSDKKGRETLKEIKDLLKGNVQ
jgi:hypothetical protein